MNCDHVQDLIPLLLEKSLDDDTARGLEEHLRDCDRCAAAVAEFEQLDDLFGSASLPPIPSSFSQGWEEALAELEVPSGRSSRFILKWAAAAAVVVAVFATGAWFGLYHRGAEPDRATTPGIRTELGAPVVLALNLSSDHGQDLDFTIQLTGGVRFLGEGLAPEKRLVMRWREHLATGPRNIRIPITSLSTGEAAVVISVKGRSGEIVRSLKFNVRSSLVAHRGVPAVVTISL